MKLNSVQGQGMRIPKATRFIKDEYVVIGKLIEDDSYLDWTIQSAVQIKSNESIKRQI